MKLVGTFYFIVTKLDTNLAFFFMKLPSLCILKHSYRGVDTPYMGPSNHSKSVPIITRRYDELAGEL